MFHTYLTLASKDDILSARFKTGSHNASGPGP
jgi:hypothetical protein